MFIETVSEIQRKSARKPGLPYTKGLWSLSRHPNYLGYTLWRTGYAIAAGGWIWGLASGALFSWDFVTRGIPVLEDYCETKVCYSFIAVRFQYQLDCSTPTSGTTILGIPSPSFSPALSKLRKASNMLRLLEYGD